MLKFVTGFLGGLLAAAAVYFFQDTKPTISHPPVAEKPSTADHHQSLWATTTNYKYNDEALEDGLGLDGLPPADHPFITLTANNPLLTLNRHDVERVCIAVNPKSHPDDIPTFYAANIFLTPEARIKVGNTMVGRAGKRVSVRIFGAEIHNFFANKEKAELSIDQAAIYTEEPDFDLFVPEHAYYSGFTTFKLILGTDTLESCNPAMPLEDFAPYMEHVALWKSMKQEFN